MAEETKSDDGADAKSVDTWEALSPRGTLPPPPQDNTIKLKWSRPSIQAHEDDDSHVPGPRSGHTFTVVGSIGFLFGGMCTEDPIGPSDVLYMLRIGSADMIWEKPVVAGEAKPLPRWKHTATLFDQTQILFFGGAHSVNQRLNDVWVFDGMTREWVQPNATHNLTAISGGEEGIADDDTENAVDNGQSEWANVPTPRSAHTATLVGDQVFVFGGYGGFGYGRHDLDDLSALDIRSWTWQRVHAKGAAPDRRSGHQACAVESKLYIFGGWNASRQLDDLWVLETTEQPPSWVEVETRMHSPCWNFAAVSVMAIPSWKVFIFGGMTGPLHRKKRQGRVTGTTAILETSENRWIFPQILGHPPCARAESTLAYDGKGCRLVLFGGWAGSWLGDVYSLDVGSVVGPPYAIMDIKPVKGPITGGTHVELIGIDYVNTEDVVVRFGARRNFIDVPGQFVSQTLITCSAPDFSRFDPAEVEVRISLNGDSYTTTYQKYNFFSVTDASKCLMFGPGLLSGCAVNEEVMFLIQARDINNLNRTTGGDAFHVRVICHEGTEDGEDLVLTGVNVHDNDDGTYVVTYIAPFANRHEVLVEFAGTFGGTAGPLRGSGVVVQFEANVSRENNTMSGNVVRDRLRTDVDYLKNFIDERAQGMMAKVKDDDWTDEQTIEALAGVREHVNIVREQASDIQLIVDRCEATVEFMERVTGTTPSAKLVKQLDACKAAWATVLDEVPNVLSRVQPLMREYTAKMRADLQEYENTVKAYNKEMHSKSFKLYATGAQDALQALSDGKDVHESEMARYSHFFHLAKVFEVERDMLEAQDLMADVGNMLDNFTKLWETAEHSDKLMADMRDLLWVTVDPDGLEENGRNLLQAVRRLPKAVKDSDAYKGLDTATREFLTTCPLLVALRADSMRERHWKQLMDIVQVKFTLPDADPNLKLSGILDLNLYKHVTKIEELAELTMMEAQHEDVLNGLDATYAMMEFGMTPHGDSELPLVYVHDDDVDQLENDLLAVQAIASSRQSFYKKAAAEWQTDLMRVGDVIEAMKLMLKLWSYLEPLFGHSEEVKRELAAEAARFEQVDAQVREILVGAWRKRTVRTACTVPGLLERMTELHSEQEVCKKALADFLEGKRCQFPRFFFISEGDLLDILSNSAQPVRVMRHISKWMLAIRDLELEVPPELEGMNMRPTAARWMSIVGEETVFIEPPVVMEGKAEVYLQKLLTAQHRTLSLHISRSYKRYTKQARTEWVMNKVADRPTDPAQIMLLVAHMHHVAEVEHGMDEVERGVGNALEQLFEKVKDELHELCLLTRNNLSKPDRNRVACMITLDAHARDILDGIVQNDCVLPSDFRWASQLKPRFIEQEEDSGSAEFQIANNAFMYGFEYTGNIPRLVITPLTDRVFMSITQALQMRVGCALSGPAGTGKTETVKDLGASLGRCCYVFNCTPEMDFRSMASVFKGLGSSGAWGCFEEFTRLVPEVLSVCSVQFKAICDCLRRYQPAVPATHNATIEGDTVRIDPNCGAFITLNPGYRGRSDLPEGLRALFRPVAMAAPDLQLICENLLLSHGFGDAPEFASKFFALYTLLSGLLSKQQHYDWGVRAVKSLVNVAARIKREEPDLLDEIILMRSLRDLNLPRLAKVDEVVFHGVLQDLFPGLTPPREIDEELSEAIAAACEDLGLWPSEEFMLKSLQLDDLLGMRHAAFILGPAASGKSSIWKALQEAHNLLDPEEKVRVVDVSPKVVSTEGLYGSVNPASREWTDGLLSKVMRDLGNIPDDFGKWIVLDGDVDAHWIESMNSVMDDNRMLTLSSNERIALKSYMRVIFETSDLSFVTPATVSRAGTLFVSAETGYQWRAYIGSWISRQPDEVLDDDARELLHTHFETYLPQVLQFFHAELKPVVPCSDMALVISFLRLLEVLFTPMVSESATALETAFVYGLVWAVGGLLVSGDDGTDYRKLFNDYWRKEFKQIKFPSRDTVFDYWLNTNSYRFEAWKFSPSFTEVRFNSRTMSMSEIIVPTSETASVTFWMTALVKKGYPIMLAGPAGTGKTQLVRGLFGSLNPEQFKSLQNNLNYYTSARSLQAVLEAPLEKRTGSTYGPAGSSKLLYFLDDLNLPKKDEYETQSVAALIRQHLDYGHWFDLVKLDVRNVLDTNYVVCMNPHAGGGHIDSRLQRHFSAFGVGVPSGNSLLAIFQTLLEGHFSAYAFSAGITNMAVGLIKSAIAVHQNVMEVFRRTTKNFHYEFNIRHLVAVFSGLFCATPDRFTDAEKFIFLWLHESDRVYGDRLSSEEDHARFQGILGDQAKRAFPQFNISRFFAEDEGTTREPLVFSHFGVPAPIRGGGRGGGDDNAEEKVQYDHASDIDSLRATLEGNLDDYNIANTPMNLVLFDDALMHVTRITRVLQQSGAHLLLVGVGGSGKRSLCRLGTYLCGFTLSCITATDTYGLSDFRKDLQEMFLDAGLRDKEVVFMLTDTDVTVEQMLVYINDLLSNGSFGDVFSKDDVDGVVAQVMPELKAAGELYDPDTCWNHFASRVRARMHCCLCFSPVGPRLRLRALKFPSLVTCTTIDWFHPWPYDALESVGRQLLRPLDVGVDEVRLTIEKFMPQVFEAVTHTCDEFKLHDDMAVHTTPKSFVELLSLYNSMLLAKRGEIDTKVERLFAGIEKLNDSADAIVDLEANLATMQEKAERKLVLASAAEEKMMEQQATVDEASAKARDDRKYMEAKSKELADREADAQADLARAEPMVAAATSALDSLDRRDLGNCQTMAKTPPGVDDVFAAVLVLLANINPNVVVQKSGKVRDKDRNWEATKAALLGNVNGLIEELKYFKTLVEEGSVPEVNFREVQQYLHMEHFQPEVMEKRNSAAAGLCMWVINIVGYFEIVQMVAPKRVMLNKTTEELAAANAVLEASDARVASLQEELDELTGLYEEAEAIRQKAQDAVEHGKLKLRLAKRLIKALGSEKLVWAKIAEDLSMAREALTGDCLLAATAVAFLGPFTLAFRSKLVHTFVPLLRTPATGLPVPMSETAPEDPLAVLTSVAQVSKWRTEGLPVGQVATANAVITLQSSRVPLLVDPQLQGIFWIRSHEARPRRAVKIVHMNDANLADELIAAIESGACLIVDSVEKWFNPVLNAVIARGAVSQASQVSKSSKAALMQVGKREIEVHDAFKLYFVTKLSSPSYPPDVQAELTIVNFRVTPDGLEEQLLLQVVQKAQPKLATQRTALLHSQNLFRVRIAAVEEDILTQLAGSEGDITEHPKLVDVLEKNMKSVRDMKEKCEAGSALEERVNVGVERYRPVAERGVLLYFLLSDLYKMHPYYLFSLNSFVVFFLRGLDVAQDSAEELAAQQEEEKEEREAAEQDAEEDKGGKKKKKKKDKDDDKAGKKKKKKKKKGGLKDRLKNAAHTAALRRFDWKVDLLRNAFAPSADELAVIRGELENKVDEALRAQSATDSKMEEGDFAAHCNLLKQEVTRVIFDSIREGFFEKDKLAIAVLLTVTVLELEKGMGPRKLRALLRPRDQEDPPPCPEDMDWLPDRAWSRLAALEEDLSSRVPDLQDLMEQFASDAEDWRTWFDNPQPEERPMPGDAGDLDDFMRAVLIRILRPDRTSFALRKVVAAELGPTFVAEQGFQLSTIYERSTASTPILFVTSPGADPTPWVEQLAVQHDMSLDNGLLVIVSMGQGQEEVVERLLTDLSRKGGWVFLQNVHLMKDWLDTFVVHLEQLSESAHGEFRCFVSAEPDATGSGPPECNLPAGLLQSSVRVTSEPAIAMQGSLKRAWATFSQEMLDDIPNNRDAFKGCLFGLCFFHSTLSGRNRFGIAGWSQPYHFSLEDLRSGADMVRQYLELDEDDAEEHHAASMIAWDDLRYLLGEVVYAGHIVDYWDRRTCLAFRDRIITPALVGPVEVAPRVRAPPPDVSDYDTYAGYIASNMPPEAPKLYGLHQNAEIGYMAADAFAMFGSIWRIRAGSVVRKHRRARAKQRAADAEEEEKKSFKALRAARRKSSQAEADGEEEELDENAEDEKAEEEEEAHVRARLCADPSLVAQERTARLKRTVRDLLRRMPQEFDVRDMSERAKSLENQESVTPYVIVLVQECMRMNTLLESMRSSLQEMERALKGLLTMSPALEALADALDSHQVPALWAQHSWVTRRSLATWVERDLLPRAAELAMWAEKLQVPHSVWLGGLFNPVAFLTAIKQVGARDAARPLDQTTVSTHVTTMRDVEDAETAPEARAGAYVHGLWMQGARWTDRLESGPQYSAGNTMCAGFLAEAHMQEIFAPMPLMYIEAVQVDASWESTSVGFIRPTEDVYNCPVYHTATRGSDQFVFAANLRTQDPPVRWVLSGAALVLQNDADESGERP